MNEEENLEAENFSDQLAAEQVRAHLGYQAPTPEELEEEEEEAVVKPKDPFDDPAPKKPAQRNWLSHGLTETVSMKKAKRGRPKGSVNKVHKRNKAMREAIQIMTAAGVRKTVMAKLLQRSVSYLNDHFSVEMEAGSDILTTRMVNALIQKGLDGNVSAIIFYLKSKAGWREVDRMDTPPGENALISDVERNQRLMSLFMNNPQFKVMFEQKRLAAVPIDISKTKNKDIFDVEEDDDEYARTI